MVQSINGKKKVNALSAAGAEEPRGAFCYPVVEAPTGATAPPAVVTAADVKDIIVAMTKTPRKR